LTLNLTIGEQVAHQEEHQDLRVLGLITFLASEFLMFAGFFATFLIFAAPSVNGHPEGTEVELLLPTINTFILVSSSFVINLGTKAIKKNDLGRYAQVVWHYCRHGSCLPGRANL
jgi:cytochrome c oxidase subunit 3